MEVLEAVRTVLAVRKYQDKPVPKEIVRHILEAGRMTASGMNSQPWHFVVVDNRELLKQLAEIETTGPYIAQAPLVIVVTIEKKKLAISDGSRAIQSMILAAWSEGVASNWVGYMGPEQVKPLLGIPEHLDVLAVLPFGYPAQAHGRGKKERKPLSEIASHGRFGRPLALTEK